MSNVIAMLREQLELVDLPFTQKPILIGGMAMEYYGIRQSGKDIDLVICDDDYQQLSTSMPDKRKDIYGDLGIVTGPFEIWRSIALLDYSFYLKDAIDEEIAYVVSIDRLLLTRVIAMDVEKYRNDLKLMTGYYYKTYTNHQFLLESEKRKSSYAKNNGIVFGGHYDE
ncbi:hypothetical protein [Gorillibacterium massiliense]|uniref:hypothetical protein n=1 Tax=Gorillibacterium massiliense TaxID=1280390 RepID=UPI0004B6DCE4|nr:hypothetical protein [Gorillibacterium massiliense]